MSHRYLIQVEASVAERLERALRTRLEELGVTVLSLLATDEGLVADGHMRLPPGEHPLDAHERIKAGLGAFSLCTRWIDLEEIAWEKEIRDAPR